MRNRVLGLFGLLLIVLIGWASEQQVTVPRTLATRARWVLGWLVIGSVTAIGWAFDRIAPVDVKADTRGFAEPRHVHGEQHR